MTPPTSALRAAAGKLRVSIALLATLVLLCTAPIALMRAQSPDVGTDAQRDAGKQLYLKYCSQCHGDKGDGDGYATPHLLPKPRNFTTGKFKIRSTPSGALPTHQDLVNIIRRGMPYTSMPGWPEFTNDQLSNLAYFITTFSPDFSNAEIVPKPAALPTGPGSSNESIEKGKAAYVEAGCVKCHGTLGRGDGPSAPTLKDDWDQPIRPADLSQPWTFRGGGSREDIFRTMSTGLNGTPMPSFADSLTPEQRWAVTDFIVSLAGGHDGSYNNLVIAKPVPEKIDLAKGAASFASAPVARFPIIGQIMEPGREFHPSATNVVAQAIYDSESIAVLVRWHDMTADKTAKNAPTLPVPMEEEEGAPAAAAPAGEKDPFGEDTPAAPVAEFSDAVSIQIPAEAPTGARKPYFLFGDSENAVDLWFFDLSGSSPLQFTGRGSASLSPKDGGDLTGVANYDQGEWSVIFKRPLKPAAGAAFAPGEFMPVAFSVWDGLARERGNKRGLTLWYSLYVEPQNVPSAVGPMIRTALIILAIELIVIGWVRWRYGPRTRNEIGSRQAATST